ncbi:MAG: hypothetical protein IJ087_14455 [Eggerthellaceae bacterium]|nr:hypothetical protein [Eggerthellaceae bacterium]
MRVNEIAAAIHRHMCECPKHGYTQGPGRWGAGWQDDCHLWLDGREYIIPGNDFECSSSVKKAWELALQYTQYAGCLGTDGYDKDGNWVSWYTGNERAGFVGTGLFDWMPMSFTADTGDLYLNERNHVAMCQTQHPDVLSEFLSNEWGGITGGKTGDQTGGESVVRAFWWPSFGWDGILHYNGKADMEDDMTPQQAEQLQFIYDHLHWDENHFSHLGNLVAEFPVDYPALDDKGELQPHVAPLANRLGYIDQRMHVIEGNQAAMGEKLDKLLEALVNEPKE